MTYKYRCSKCRTRNTFKKKLKEYIRAKKCRHCGYHKFYYDKEHNRRRPMCLCSGAHYPHRPGSSCCFQNPNYGKVPDPDAPIIDIPF